MSLLFHCHFVLGFPYQQYFYEFYVIIDYMSLDKCLLSSFHCLLDLFECFCFLYFLDNNLLSSIWSEDIYPSWSYVIFLNINLF